MTKKQLLLLEQSINSMLLTYHVRAETLSVSYEEFDRLWTCWESTYVIRNKYFDKLAEEFMALMHRDFGEGNILQVTLTQDKKVKEVAVKVVYKRSRINNHRLYKYAK